jgi:hypothetical protein
MCALCCGAFSGTSVRARMCCGSRNAVGGKLVTATGTGVYLHTSGTLVVCLSCMCVLCGKASSGISVHAHMCCGKTSSRVCVCYECLHYVVELLVV